MTSRPLSETQSATTEDKNSTFVETDSTADVPRIGLWPAFCRRIHKIHQNYMALMAQQGLFENNDEYGDP